jgi:hypothetical protein
VLWYCLCSVLCALCSGRRGENGADACVRDAQGNELLAIFEVTRDKEDTRRAEDYFKSACKLDPSVAEEADEGRQQAIAKRRSRRQRAANTAAERRRSVVEGVRPISSALLLQPLLLISTRMRQCLEVVSVPLAERIRVLILWACRRM